MKLFSRHDLLEQGRFLSDPLEVRGLPLETTPCALEIPGSLNGRPASDHRTRLAKLAIDGGPASLPPGASRWTRNARQPAAVAAESTEGVAWAKTEVEIAGQDVRGLTMVLQPALRMNGRIVFDRRDVRADVTRLDLRALGPSRRLQFHGCIRN